MKNKKQLILFLSLMLIILCLTNSYARQMQDESTLTANKELAFILKKGESKTVFLDLKKGQFAEIFWQDSLQRFPEFKLESPSGKSLERDFYISDSLPFVAPENGKYRLTVKFDDAGDESNEDARVTVSYSDKFQLPKTAKFVRQRKINGYSAKVFNDQETSNTYLIIEKNGKLYQVLKGGSLVGGGFNFADDAALFDFAEGKKSSALMRNTPDKTGDGTPDIAIQFYTGGAHCCIDLNFFEFGNDGVTKLPTVAGMDSDVLAIGKKLKGSLILKTGDSAFAYWQACFACSPIPDVILSFSKGEFRPDLKLMKKPAPSLAVLRLKAAKARKKMNLTPYVGEGVESSEGFMEAFWGEMLVLMYSGNETSAWQYFDLVWDKRKAGKEKFKEDFLSRLNKGNYWKMMQEDRLDK